LPAIVAFAETDKELAKEIALGQKVAAQIERQLERIADPRLEARVAMILQRFMPSLQRDLPYEVRIIKEDSPNAFSLPGGIIYVTSGMLDFVKSDAELAGVIAHELVHAENRHVMIQVARNQRLSLLALGVAIAGGGEIAALVLGNVAQVAIMNAYSRDLEREADLGAATLLAERGYPPIAVVTTLERLEAEEWKRPYFDPGIYLDHPRVSERVTYLIDFLRSKGWPIRRKEALHLLRVQVRAEGSEYVMMIDNFPVWKGPQNPETKALLDETASRLDRALQLETQPYDVQVIQLEGVSHLKVGRDLVASEEELLPGMPSLEDFRNSLVEALQRSRAQHPIANYLK
jgi:predicted Zn-dependent protease